MVDLFHEVELKFKDKASVDLESNSLEEAFVNLTNIHNSKPDFDQNLERFKNVKLNPTIFK